MSVKDIAKRVTPKSDVKTLSETQCYSGAVTITRKRVDNPLQRSKRCSYTLQQLRHVQAGRSTESDSVQLSGGNSRSAPLDLMNLPAPGKNMARTEDNRSAACRVQKLRWIDSLFACNPWRVYALAICSCDTSLRVCFPTGLSTPANLHEAQRLGCQIQL